MAPSALPLVTDVQVSYNGSQLVFLVSTDIPVRLKLQWSLSPPTKEPFYKRVRGHLTLCGYSVVWGALTCAPCEIPEPALTHQFTIPAPAPAYFVWAFFSDECAYLAGGYTSLPFSVLVPDCPFVPPSPGSVQATTDLGVHISPGASVFLDFEILHFDTATWWAATSSAQFVCKAESQYRLNLRLRLLVPAGPPFYIIGVSWQRNGNELGIAGSFSTAFQDANHHLNCDLPEGFPTIYQNDVLQVRVTNTTPVDLEIVEPLAQAQIQPFP